MLTPALAWMEALQTVAIVERYENQPISTIVLYILSPLKIGCVKLFSHPTLLGQFILEPPAFADFQLERVRLSSLPYLLFRIQINQTPT